MKCRQCNHEVKPNSKFCENCGCPITQPMPQQRNFQQRPMQPLPPLPMQQRPIPQKPKKGMKGWQVALICVGCVVGGFIFIGALGTSIREYNSEYSSDVSYTHKETEPTKSPEEVEQEFKDSCTTIDFADLSRNPDKYKGNNYKFTGEVIQVQEGWHNTVDLRINVTKEEYDSLDIITWSDTIYATIEIPEGEDKILEDDVITFWGTCDGEYTYTAVLGNKISLPKIDIEYYELNN